MTKMSAAPRFQSVDIVRGLVMIIMAIDHTRDLFHITATTEDPTNLATTTPALFFTRWITHLCAPSFVFLSGFLPGSLCKKNQLQMLNSSFLVEGYG
ncbi:MAG: heparan-alpha-glucosaminide N-acetyltransferase domain-containing protein [Chitinophagaceae bacterium]|nr:heparan-alpha-glucosaminide N-acetyltransferase domain-containing protein [Chitinophagaceae bacterium]